MSKFLPPLSSLGLGDGDGDGDKPVLELTHVAIQITVFTCGGVSIGWYDIHKIMDGISGSTFLNYWAGLSSQTPEADLIRPDFESCVSAFPPTTKPLELPSTMNSYTKEQHNNNSTIIANRPKLADAKAVSKTVAKPTSFLAIAGFIWENLLSISSISKTVENDTGLKGSVLQVTLDLRPRVDPPLHKGCIGNLALIAVAKVENQTEMPELVAEINSSISEMNGYRGEEGVESVMESWRKVISTSEEYKDRVYRLTSWSRLGFNELDFGFGKPVRMIPTDGKMCEFHKNMIILNDFKGEDGDHGIEAWLFLVQNDMEALICKREFLAFVSLVN
ncbi:stemmadenine O-acetyltransferase-like [Silene latifolia]|uniref:stemmadenine O-acetyltransferase-like n=1 Tax=Silene latifolia TaxID=37657 RepID=UPI003D7713DE